MRMPPPRRPAHQRPRAYYIHHGFGFGHYGSVYKYLKLFEQVCDVVADDAVAVGETPEERLRRDIRAAEADFVIVNGDFHPQYTIPLAMGIPYVIFQHDVVTLRGRACVDEGVKLRSARAVVYTSEEHKAHCESRYRLRNGHLIPLKPLAADLAFERLPKFEGKTIGFTGSVTPDSQRHGQFGYRCYSSVFKTLASCGWQVHAVTFEHLRSDVERMLDHLGVVTHYEVPQDEVYQLLNRCTIGLQGYAPYGEPDAAAYVHTCRPNKLWEYLAAGIPTLGANPGRGGSIYDGKWGLVSPSFDKADLCRTAEAAAAMTITDEMRYGQAIDTHVNTVKRIVNTVMEAYR